MQKNKFVLLILCLLAALCVGACAEGTDPGAIQCEIVDGNYVIRIPAAENDLGWYAEEPAVDAAVKLISAEMKDGCFVAQYAPAADGTATVSVRHAYCAAACDQALTWDLAVRDGRITESTGGSYTANPPEEEMDAAISGAWQEAGTQFTTLSIRKNENRGWDVEAISPMTHGAYVFKTTVYYDCAEDAFLYDKGKFFDLNTDGSIQSEARAAGTSGSFKFTLNDEQKFLLMWTDPEAPQPCP